MIQHLAIVMDGNRRWALKQGLKPWLGHQEGAQAVKRAIEFCLKRGISHLSLYAFSIENFKRSPQETSFIFDLLVHEAQKELPVLLERGIKVKFRGDYDLFPGQTRETIESVQKQTAHLDTLSLHVLFCYGGQQEIVSGVKEVVKQVQQGLLSVDGINDQTFANFLWTAGTPAPELIVRTGGRQRLSNFLLYYAAYSELCFLDCLWPDITTAHLEQALDQFNEVTRNFGS